MMATTYSLLGTLFDIEWCLFKVTKANIICDSVLVVHVINFATLDLHLK
jgi:hypothetical protein